mgnify:CR=1 FL=1
MRKTLFNMTDEEISILEKQRIEDKFEDLEVEAVKLPSAEQEEGDGEEGGGEDFGGEELDFGDDDMDLASDDRNTKGLGLIAEDDDDDMFSVGEMSINDEEAPIKAQNRVNMLSGLIDEKTASKETQAEKDIANKKRRKVKTGMTDHLALVSHDYKDVSDSLTHPDGEKLRKQQTNSEKKDPSGLRNAHKMPKLTEDDTFISTFFDEKVAYQTRMTSRLRSALKSLDSKISNKTRVILEGDNPEEEEGE